MMMKCSSCNARFTNKQALSTHVYPDSPACRKAMKAPTTPASFAPSQSMTRTGRGSMPASGTMMLPRGLQGSSTDVAGIASVFSALNIEGGNNGTEVTVVHRHAAEPKAKKVTKVLNKQVNMLIDASGSMRGAGIEQAKDGGIDVVNSLNPERDWFGVATFHSGMTVLHDPVCLKHASSEHGTKKKELNYILRNYCLEGGGTRMRDTIIDRMSAFVPPPKKGPKLVIQPELVVITDGADNRSKTDAAETNKFIMNKVAKTPWME